MYKYLKYQYEINLYKSKSTLYYINILIHSLLPSLLNFENLRMSSIGSLFLAHSNILLVPTYITILTKIINISNFILQILLWAVFLSLGQLLRWAILVLFPFSDQLQGLTLSQHLHRFLPVNLQSVLDGFARVSILSHIYILPKSEVASLGAPCPSTNQLFLFIPSCK